MRRNDALKQVPDLRLALGTPARRDLEIPSLNSVANDALCELEWSRRNGLIVRYAVCGVPEKSSLPSSAAPSGMIHSTLRSTATENSRGKITEERTFANPSMNGQTPTCKSGLEDGRMQKFSQESSSQCRELNQSKTSQKEDDLHGKEQVCLEVYEISKASPIRAFASGRKGKQKALPDCDLRMGVSQEEDESYKSSESFNSTGIRVGKKRVMSFEEQLIVGSKRLKMQIQEAHGSTRSNSSFANWISTMITGSPRPDTSKRVLRSDTSNGMGFQTLFESIYRPKLKAQDERSSRSNNALVVSNPGDLMAVEPNLDSSVLSRKKDQSNNRVAHHGGFGSSAVWNEERLKKFSGEGNLEIKEGPMLIMKGSANSQKDDAPSRIFEAVKSLRLSRADIMKWTNSVFSSELDGYYLRLRVGKSGQGLGGASYQVACICRSEGGDLAEASRRPLSVIVGGAKCLVECQYISNQDFLEDELKEWWTATLRDDGKIPSEDELRLKVEERRRLGL